MQAALWFFPWGLAREGGRKGSVVDSEHQAKWRRQNFSPQVHAGASVTRAPCAVGEGQPSECTKPAAHSLFGFFVLVFFNLLLG